MLRVNGFYGHIKRNDLRSAAMFIGFLVAFQLIAAVTLFVPLFFFDISHAPLHDTPGYLMRYTPIVLVAGGVLFLVQFLCHVASIRSMAEFSYIDRRANPRLFNIVEVQAIAAGLPLPKIGLIESPARNAFACGLRARSAVVVATRGLVEALDDDELAAVMAHEIAHIKNGDIRLMAAANVMMDNLDLLQRNNPLRVIGYKQIILFVLMPPSLLLFLLAGLVTRVALTLARVSRLLISSSREFVADAEAVRLTHNPAALISALQRIDGRSAVTGISPRADAMMIDGAVEGVFASHPTIAERVAVLMRLSGTMANSIATRKDTRPMDQVTAHRDTVWSRPASDPWRGPERPCPRSLIGRVNSGSRENFLGIKRKHVGFYVAGVVALVAVSQLNGMRLQSILSRWPSSGAETTRFQSLDGGPEVIVEGPESLKDDSSSMRGTFAIRPGSPNYHKLQRLAATNSIEARCFATSFYEVGDRGLHPLNPPDLDLVQAFSVGNADQHSAIKLERYLGYRVRSLRAAISATGADFDPALLAYVNNRKSMLRVVHEFFGEPGLRFMQKAYDSPADRTILDTLRVRVDDRAVALIRDRQIASEIRLLVSAPESFIPCVARAAMAVPADGGT